MAKTACDLMKNFAGTLTNSDLYSIRRKTSQTIWIASFITRIPLGKYRRPLSFFPAVLFSYKLCFALFNTTEHQIHSKWTISLAVYGGLAEIDILTLKLLEWINFPAFFFFALQKPFFPFVLRMGSVIILHTNKNLKAPIQWIHLILCNTFRKRDDMPATSNKRVIKLMTSVWHAKQFFSSLRLIQKLLSFQN